MRALCAAACLAAFAACTPKDEQPAPPPPPPAPINLTEVAGTWAFGARDMANDSTILFFKITATADTAGWMIELPNRKPMKMQVRTDGDSVMTAVGPYESVLSKGLQVSTTGVMRYQDGRLGGITTATYKTAKGDSVVQFRSDGTRTP